MARLRSEQDRSFLVFISSPLSMLIRESLTGSTRLTENIAFGSSCSVLSVWRVVLSGLLLVVNKMVMTSLVAGSVCRCLMLNTNAVPKVVRTKKTLVS